MNYPDVSECTIEWRGRHIMLCRKSNTAECSLPRIVLYLYIAAPQGRSHTATPYRRESFYNFFFGGGELMFLS